MHGALVDDEPRSLFEPLLPVRAPRNRQYAGCLSSRVTGCHAEPHPKQWSHQRTR